MTIDRAITLRPCWAWAVAHAGKRVENRSWATRFRGPIYIHAGCGRTIAGDRASLQRRCGLAGIEYPDEAGFERGALIAVATIADCVRLDRADPWAEPGCWHFLLEDVRRIAPIPMPGKLGIWRVH